MGSALTGQPSTSTWRAGGSLTEPVAFREVVIAQSGDVVDLSTSITLSSGSGAPSHTRQDGSWYYRNNGDTYKRVSGVWTLVSVGETQVVGNKTGGALTKSQLVYISGYDATLDCPTVTAATNTDLDTRAGLVLEENIANNASGAASAFARITGLNTSGYTAVGTKLYLDTAGAVTQTAPTASTAIVQEVGEVKVKDATAGEILFYPGYSKVQGIEYSDIMGLTANTTELNYLDGVTLGTVSASLAVTVDANKDVGEFRNISAALLTRASNDLAISTTTSGNLTIDAATALAIEAAGGAISIGADAVAQAINIGTGAAARAISIGNAASASISMDAGVGAFALLADTTIDLDAGGAIGIESSAGAISVGADAVAQAVNIATGGAARVITIGNAASASLTLEGGVGGIDIDCDTTFDVLAGGAFSIDGTGASNVSATSGNLTLSSITSGDVIIDSAANIQLAAASGSTLQFQDDADNTKVTTFDSSAITTSTTRNLTMADANVNLGASPCAVLMPVLGTWAVSGDAIRTNGAGMCGFVAQTAAWDGNAYCKSYDSANAEYWNLNTTSSGTDMTNDWQFFSDTKSDNDAVYFGQANRWCEMGIDMSATVQNYTGDALTWEYSQGSSAWAALTLAWDGTDATANDGKRSFQQDGAISFAPPADWATETVDSQEAYWIRARISTTANIGANEAQTNTTLPDKVVATDGFRAPWTGTIDTIHLADGAATLHTATDVKFVVYNQNSGAHSGELTFAQDLRNDTWTSLSMAVTEGDELTVLCTQEDGANEPAGVLLSLQGTRII